MAKLLGVGLSSLSSATEEDLRQANHMPQSVPSDEQSPSVASFQVNSDAPEQDEQPPLAERFEQAPPAPENPTPVEATAHRLKTPEGRKEGLCSAQTDCQFASNLDTRYASSLGPIGECWIGLIQVVHRWAALSAWESASPRSFESGNFGLNDAVICRMSLNSVVCFGREFGDDVQDEP